MTSASRGLTEAKLQELAELQRFIEEEAPRAVAELTAGMSVEQRAAVCHDYLSDTYPVTETAFGASMAMYHFLATGLFE